MRELAGAAGHASTATTVSATSLFGQLVVALVVVVGSIAVLSWFVRRRGGVPRARTGAVTVLGRQSLGKGVQVAVVRAGDRTYVLGVTPHGISRLGTAVAVPDEEPVPVPMAAGGRSGPVGWRDALRGLQERTVRRAAS